VPKIPKLPPPMPRLPKEPAPEMLRTFGPRPPMGPAAHEPGAAPIASPSPSAFRAENPYQAPPSVYKPPSLLKEHRRLAILFAGVAAAFTFYCLRTPHGLRSAEPRATPPAATRSDANGGHAAVPSAAASDPVYIESVPDKDAR
jgi:hypothetical protein